MVFVVIKLTHFYELSFHDLVDEEKHDLYSVICLFFNFRLSHYLLVQFIEI